ncbi:MAG: helix-turn-helix domain-containing protein [Pseudomonadota bacterium]
MARTYNQECVLAYALDLLGERWTLLIMRELFLGPLRFGDLHAALPGIGTNLLSKRLKELEEAGLILSNTSDGRGKYRLSDRGDMLRPTFRELIMWSVKYFLERPEPSEAKDCILSNDLIPDSVALAVEIFLNKHSVSYSNYVVHLKIDDHPYTFYLMNGETTVKRGDDTPAVATILTDVASMMRAMRSEISIDKVKKTSVLTGDQDVIDHFLQGIVPEAAYAEAEAKLIKNDENRLRTA